MGYILSELNHVRNTIGHPEDEDKEKLKEKLKHYIKEEILPFVELVDNGYDYEIIFPNYRVWELLHYPYILEVFDELKKEKEIEIEIHYLMLGINEDPLCSMAIKKYRSPK